MSNARRTKISSVGDAFQRHDDRWREGLRSLGLDPDVRADHYRAPAGFWFDIQDELRRDLTALGACEETVTRRVAAEARTVDTPRVDELESLRSDLKALMGHS